MMRFWFFVGLVCWFGADAAGWYHSQLGEDGKLQHDFYTLVGGLCLALAVLKWIRNEVEE